MQSGMGSGLGLGWGDGEYLGFRTAYALVLTASALRTGQVDGQLARFLGPTYVQPWPARVHVSLPGLKAPSLHHQWTVHGNDIIDGPLAYASCFFRRV